MSTPAKHTAFTPGPWTNDTEVLIRGQDGPRVGFINCEPGSRTDREARANLRLIGASPTMFDALTELKAAIEDGLCNSGTPGFDKGRLDRAMTAAGTALAAATPILGREG